MPYPPEQFIPLLDAVTRATSGGIAIELLHGVDMRPHELTISLTTSDSRPILIVREHGRRAGPTGELRERRQQSDGDTWDYPMSVHCWSDRLVLRLSRGGKWQDVVALPAVMAMLIMRWCEDPTMLAPALVRADEFNAALAQFDE